MSLSKLLYNGRDDDHVVALRANDDQVTWREFYNDILCIRDRLNLASGFKTGILACEDTYYFMVAFLAMVSSEIEIVIGANLQEDTLKLLRKKTGGHVICDDFISQGLKKDVPKIDSRDLSNSCDIQSVLITLYTSGSTGEPKAITKSISALEAEIAMFHDKWGNKFSDKLFLSSVVHYHAYGLPFHILWSLCSGAVCGLERILYPETLMRYKKYQVNFISSPAFLNQFAQIYDTQENYDFLKFISAAGAPLDHAVSKKISSRIHDPIVEIYGSTETGAIAFKTYHDDAVWQRFSSVNLDVSEDGIVSVLAPHIGQNTPYALEDKIDIISNEQFRLLGRADRVVKIFENRVSLNNMEQVCGQSSLVLQSKITPLPDTQRLGCVVILTMEGKEILEKHGKNALIQAIKLYLRSGYNLVVLPRKWRFVEAFPYNEMGKIQTHLLQNLFLEKEPQ